MLDTILIILGFVFLILAFLRTPSKHVDWGWLAVTIFAFIVFVEPLL